MNDIEELKSKFKKFATKSKEHFKDFYERIKNDREFLYGSHWSKDDERLLGKKRAVGNTINFLANGVRSVCNTYATNPFLWETGDNALDQASSQFLADVDNCTALQEVLQNAVSTGLGYLVISVVLESGVQKPCLYSVADVCKVLYDSDSTKINGSDATEAAIIELKSKRWVKNNYGEEYDCDCDRFSNRYDFDIDEVFNRKDYVPLITYFVKENDGVTVYKLLGNSLCEEPFKMAISNIPVIPVYGSKMWIDDEISYCGIVHQGRAIQKTLDYAYVQLQERLAKSPKNTWVTGARAVQNYEEYYKQSDTTINPLLIYNDLAPDGKTPLAPPTRLPNTVEFNDVLSIIKESLGIMQTIIGIDAIGLQEADNRSATEVIANQKTFQNNIRHYMNNLKESFKSAGRIFFELLGIPSVKVNVIEGPEATMEREVARVEIMSILPILTDETEKKLALSNIMSTFNDNSYLRNFMMGLNSLNIPSQSELQGQQLLQQADIEMKNKDMQILELQKQLAEMKQQQDLQAYGLQRELTLAKQKHLYEMEKLAWEKQLEENPAQVEKEVLAVKKEEIQVQKEAVGLAKEISGAV